MGRYTGDTGDTGRKGCGRERAREGARVKVRGRERAREGARGRERAREEGERARE